MTNKAYPVAKLNNNKKKTIFFCIKERHNVFFLFNFYLGFKVNCNHKNELYLYLWEILAES